MNKIGITGLIASGKSSVAKILSKNNYPIFDADLEVKKIYQKKIFKNRDLKREEKIRNFLIFWIKDNLGL